MDTTALGILLGLGACVAYALVRAVRQGTFDLIVTILSFLAGFSIPGGAALIRAGVAGDPATLPGSWREYVAVAGVVALGLAAQYLFESFRAVWPKRAASLAPEQPASTQEPQAPG